MEKWKFTRWCNTAAGKIRYFPDREHVAKELRDHLEDRYECFLAAGCSEEVAVDKALDAMGSAEEIAPQLAAVHRPFWGFLYSISKWIFRISVAIMITLTAGNIAISMINGEFRIHNTNWNPMYDPSFVDAQRTHYSEPDVRYYDSGYVFTLTQAAVWESPQRDSADLFFKIRIQAILPGAIRPDIIDHLWADDNLGRFYYPYSEGRYINHDRSVFGNCTQITPITWEYELRIYDFDAQGTQWIDIHYDREGRDMVLRIDLAGGDSDAEAKV